MRYRESIHEELVDLANILLDELNEKNKKNLRDCTDPSLYHFSLGLYIRNKYYYTNAYPFICYYNADDASADVIETMIEILNKDRAEMFAKQIDTVAKLILLELTEDQKNKLRTGNQFIDYIYSDVAKKYAKKYIEEDHLLTPFPSEITCKLRVLYKIIDYLKGEDKK